MTVPSTETTVTTATPAAPAAPAGNTPDGDGETKTFTQAEVNAIVKDQAKRRVDSKYGDYDDLKAKAAKLDEIEAASASDLEKATKAAREEGEQAARSRSDLALAKASARALAAEAGFQDPSDAVAFLKLDDVKVNDDAEVDEGTLKERLDELAKSKAYLLKAEQNNSTAAAAGIGVAGDAVQADTPRGRIAAGLAKSSKQ